MITNHLVQKAESIGAAGRDPGPEDGAGTGALTVYVCITKTKKAESEAQRGKPKDTLESESRNAIL